MQMPDGTEWSPDAATIAWISGIIDEGRVQRSIDYVLRNEEGQPSLAQLADAAIEAVVWSVHETAVKWGMPPRVDPETS